MSTNLDLERFENEGGSLGLLAAAQLAAGPENGDSSLNSNHPRQPSSKPVYPALADHQQTEDWAYRDLINELHRWTKIFNEEFSLGVEEIALRVDWLRYRALGHFRYGSNGFGLRGEIAINERHLHNRQPWQILGTLLHELLHAWQQSHGKPGKGNYHNKQFRDKAREYGLIIETNGYTQYAPDSRFKTLLAKHGIKMPQLPPPALMERGNSSQKLWMCPCKIRARVFVSHFWAKCLHCGGEYVQVG